MSFTAAELAEMALADAEIEAEFALTMDDLSLSRMLDRRANLERMDPGLRKLAEYHRAYYEANKDKLAEYHRAYYEANKDKLAERQRAYYEANKDKLAERHRAYYEANKDKLAERQRAYREANKDKLAEYHRAYYEANKDKLAEQKRAIKSIREEFGMTQRDLANLLGVTQSTISLWESGSVPVDLEKLREIMLRGEPPCENC